MLTVTIRFRRRRIVVTVPNGDDDVVIDVSSQLADQKLVTLA